MRNDLLQTNFTGGEMSPRLYGRPDIPFRLRYGLVILLGVFAALGAASLAMPPTG